MKPVTQGIDFFTVRDVICSRCHLPYDYTVIQNENGQIERYLQCLTCFDRIRLSSVKTEIDANLSH